MKNLSAQIELFAKIFGVLTALCAGIYAAASVVEGAGFRIQQAEIRLQKLEDGDKDINKSIQQLQIDSELAKKNTEWIVRQMGGTPATPHR